MAIPSAINPKIMDKNIFPYTLWCYKICRNNISFSLEKAQQWAKAWLIKNIISAIEKINLSIKISRMRNLHLQIQNVLL